MLTLLSTWPSDRIREAAETIVAEMRQIYPDDLELQFTWTIPDAATLLETRGQWFQVVAVMVPDDGRPA